MEPLYCGHHGTIAACLDYRGVHISEASGIFLVGEGMHTHAVECYEGMRPRALPSCMLVRKADQRLELCEPMVL